MVRHIALLLVMIGLLTTACVDHKSASGKIKVVSTIKPINSNVVAIAGDKVDAVQLIPDFASPHSYSIKPSDIRKIKKADIIFRIDENMEVMLQPVLALREAHTRFVSLADEAWMKLLPFSREQSNENPKEKGMSAHAHEHGNIDLHIWTSPDNSIAMATLIAQTLIAADSANKGHYENNLQMFVKAVRLATKNIQHLLEPVKNSPYLVFHNSWQYFSHYFGLKAPVIFSLQQSISADVKSIKEARKRIVEEGITCVFSEPGVRAARVNILIEGLGINTAEIDVLQSKFTVNKSTYVHWLIAMANDVKGCLE